MFFRLPWKKKEIAVLQIQSKSSKESNVSALKQAVYNRNPKYIEEKEDQNSWYNPCINCNTTIASIYGITSPSGVSQIELKVLHDGVSRKSNVDIFYFSFFRLERARPPCQCADVLNWLVILIEFHYTPGGQSLGAGFKCTPEWVALIHGCATRAHARTHARNARQKRFTAVCRRDDSKNADNSTVIKRRRLLWKYFSDRNNVSPAGFHRRDSAAN